MLGVAGAQPLLAAQPKSVLSLGQPLSAGVGFGLPGVSLLISAIRMGSTVRPCRRTKPGFTLRGVRRSHSNLGVTLCAR